MNSPAPSSTRAKMERVLQAKVMVQITRSLGDLYGLMEQLTSDVLDLYPHIACRTQCNTCCKGTSMPVASASEWAHAHAYLSRYWSLEQRQALITRVKTLYQAHADILWEVHANIQQPPDMAKLEKFARLLPRMEDSQCPFLIDEKCGMYAGRPAKCRAHGGFLFIFQEHVQLSACASEVEKMEDYVQKQGSRKIIMPFWNDFETKIVRDFNPPGAVSTVLPLWVMAHIEADDLSAEPNLLPDFAAVRSLWSALEQP